jgi:hypothetical protein
LVKSVESGSAAAQAGIQSGDVLAAAGERKLFGQADFRGVLHRGPIGDGEIEVHWLRDGELKHGILRVKDGWRKTILDWRMSVAEGNIGASPGFFPLRVSPEQRRAIGLDANDKAVRVYMGPNTRRRAPGRPEKRRHRRGGQWQPHTGRGTCISRLVSNESRGGGRSHVDNCERGWQET